ncbi:hypothetical protein BVY03_06125 [bacterium K02(2017)]|nr:hypothetical protein BVY03_06125 [bacterium K02(2017)]
MSSKATEFLIVANNANLKEQFINVCAELSFNCDFANSFDQALIKIDSTLYRYIFIDLEDKNLKTLQILEWLQTRHVYSKVGIIFDQSYPQKFIEAANLGATEFIGRHDLDIKWLKGKLSFFIKHFNAQESLKSHTYLDKDSNSLSWIGVNPQTRFSFEKAKAYSNLPIPILIKGEPGSGKSTLAKIISNQHPSIHFDLINIPEYEQKETIFNAIKETLNNYQQNTSESIQLSLCIEHIDLLHLEVQEVLAEYFTTRHLDINLFDKDGNRTELKIMLQLIGSTSKNLDKFVIQNKFRADLTLLLKQNQIDLLPLRERKEDIPFLVEHFLNQTNEKIKYFSKDAMATLHNYTWSHNVSGLASTIKETLKVSTEPMITSRDLPPKILQQSFYTQSLNDETLSDFSYNDAKKKVLNKFNRSYIIELLSRSDNNLTVAAEKAGMDRSNFKKIIKKYGLSK